MAISERREPDNRIETVRFDAERMYVDLRDGREISVPLWQGCSVL